MNPHRFAAAPHTRVAARDNPVESSGPFSLVGENLQ